MPISKAKRRALKAAQKGAQTPEAQAKRTASIRAFHANKRASANFPVVLADPPGPRPIIEYEGDRPRRATKSTMSDKDRADLLKAHMAIMLKLLP